MLVRTRTALRLVAAVLLSLTAVACGDDAPDALLP